MAKKDKEFELPLDVRNRILKGIRYDAAERQRIFDTFVKKFLKVGSDDPDNVNRCVVHLDKTLDKKCVKPQQSQTGKKLSYRKRKELGLYTLGKKSLKYNELLPLHKLWTKYMTKYMNLGDGRTQSWVKNPDDPNFEQVSAKLYRADYHGAKLKVIKSVCPGYVGLSGIVAMETKNCFKLLGRDNTVRNIPKASCVFTFKIRELEFMFYGKNFQVKPAERSSKKIKTIYVSELQL